MKSYVSLREAKEFWANRGPRAYKLNWQHSSYVKTRSLAVILLKVRTLDGKHDVYLYCNEKTITWYLRLNLTEDLTVEPCADPLLDLSLLAELESVLESMPDLA